MTAKTHNSRNNRNSNSNSNSNGNGNSNSNSNGNSNDNGVVAGLKVFLASIAKCAMDGRPIL
jgi:hypothetical protein